MIRLLFALWTLQPITVKVIPRIAVAPVTISVEARLIPIESDRKASIVIESETFYRSSDCPIEGAAGPKRCPNVKPLTVDLRDAGIYTISAGVGDWSHYRAVDRVTLEVLSN
jgi:hypothetical protein